MGRQGAPLTGSPSGRERGADRPCKGAEGPRGRNRGRGRKGAHRRGAEGRNRCRGRRGGAREPFGVSSPAKIISHLRAYFTNQSINFNTGVPVAQI